MSNKKLSMLYILHPQEASIGYQQKGLGFKFLCWSSCILSVGVNGTGSLFAVHSSSCTHDPELDKGKNL